MVTITGGLVIHPPSTVQRGSWQSGLVAWWEEPFDVETTSSGPLGCSVRSQCKQQQGGFYHVWSNSAVWQSLRVKDGSSIKLETSPQSDTEKEEEEEEEE